MKSLFITYCFIVALIITSGLSKTSFEISIENSSNHLMAVTSLSLESSDTLVDFNSDTNKDICAYYYNISSINTNPTEIFDPKHYALSENNRRTNSRFSSRLEI